MTQEHDFLGKPREHLTYPDLTMFQMVERMAQTYPEEPAFLFYDRKTSYARFTERIEACAKGLQALGVEEGTRVTLCLPNIPQALDAFYAINRLGAVANMVHPLSAEEEITYYLNCAQSPFIVTVDMFYEKVRAAIEKADHPVKVITVRLQDELPFHLKAAYVVRAGHSYLKYPLGEDISWKHMIRDDAGQTLAPAAYVPDRTAVILYSGGTTGKPKGICLTDLNFNACAMQARECIQENFRPGLTMLSCMPMFHGFGLGINIHTVLIHGACCILMPTFNTRSYARMLMKKRPNFIAGVPTIFDALLRAEDLKTANLSFLMGMFCGGDTLPVELKKRVDTFLKEHGARIQIREGYGLTECVTASCLTPKDTYRPGSIGLPFPDTVYDIVEPGTDVSCPRGTAGEIVLKGPTLMQGYLDEEEETKAVLKSRSDGDKWLYTGDMGYMDADGYVYFLQRIKRMIVTNGYNVYPSVVEDAIDALEGVDYSCVIGVPDKRRGSRIRAYIVLKDMNRIFDKTEEEVNAVRREILEGLGKKVAAYALPREIVFREELPRTLVGKVAFHELEKESAQT